MIKNYKTLNMLDKSILWNIFYSGVALIIGLVLLLLNSSWVFGILFGLILTWATLIVNQMIYSIPSKGAMNAVGLPTITLILRIIIFAVAFCVVIFVINPALTGLDKWDTDLLFNDINALVILFVYLIPMYSFFTVGIIDFFKKDK